MKIIVWFVASWVLVICTAYRTLSNGEIKNLLNDEIEKLLDINSEEGLLKPLLKPRVPGTKGHLDIEGFIIDTANSLNGRWHVDTDRFVADTPVKRKVPFNNIILTRDPPNFIPGQSKRLVLAAHYDSKRLPDGFIGAIDSAVPCAMLLYLMKTLDKELMKRWDSRASSSSESDMGLRMIFFDGEEAFHEWTDQDSIYGARHLAARWQNEPRESGNDLESISVLVLLDLLGSSNPDIRPYFERTRDLHSKLKTINRRLSRSNMSRLTDENTFFPSNSYNMFIGDDHLPFMAKNVPILHIIPGTFPSQWHKMDDNASNLDQNTIFELSSIFKIFVAEFLHLSKPKTSKTEL